MDIGEKLLVVDFGSQYTQLIARKVREEGVYSEILPCTASADELRAFEPRGVILSGGPGSMFEADAPDVDPVVYELGVPILGICYGMQLVTTRLGGRVGKGVHGEYGRAHIALEAPSAIIPSQDDGPEAVWMSHFDVVEEPAPGFRVTARSTDGMIAAIEDPARRIYCVQFHPEVHHTSRGPAMLRRFVREVCGLEGRWSMASFLEHQIAHIRATVGDGKVLCGMSGGVDSSVTATLLHRAIGDGLQSVLVDTGLMRKDEVEEVRRVFAEGVGIKLDVVDASDRFFDRLAGVEEPEAKRKIIGATFIDVFAEYARAHDDIAFLAQGTLYPDVIESVSFKGPSATIKSHHNVGGLPDDLDFTLVEPLRELFKDEVRALGRVLGLGDEVVSRQPFPGPGLGVRILGEVTRERVSRLQEADWIMRDELSRHPWWSEVWQSLAVLLPVKTVGVMGDRRTYQDVLAVRAVSSVDGMTADAYPIPHDVLNRLAVRIIGADIGINRVVYDVSSKPPATIEWE